MNSQAKRYSGSTTWDTRSEAWGHGDSDGTLSRTSWCTIHRVMYSRMFFLFFLIVYYLSVLQILELLSVFMRMLLWWWGEPSASKIHCYHIAAGKKWMTFCRWHAVKQIYSTIIFFQNTHKRHSIARPNRWAMECPLCVHTLHLYPVLVFVTLRPTQNGWNFVDNIFKCIFFNENVWISIKISPKFIPKGPVHNIAALVQIMAWHCTGDKPLSESMVN